MHYETTIPTVTDRLIQQALLQVLQPLLDPTFSQHSYGFRPGRSAHQAVHAAQAYVQSGRRVVVDVDLEKFFDRVNHDILIDRLRQRVADAGVIRLVRAYLTSGIMDGGLLMARSKERLAECGLEMHPDKTHVVYCKDGSRKEEHPNTKFDFLGYSFRPRVVKNRKRNSLFVSFTPAVSSSALKSMRETTRKFNFRNRTELSLQDISRLHNPVLRGWMAYYGKFCPSAMYPVFRHFNMTLVAWAMRKYRRLKGHKMRASLFLEQVAEKQPHLFVHWQNGTVGAFA